MLWLQRKADFSLRAGRIPLRQIFLAHFFFSATCFSSVPGVSGRPQLLFVATGQ
jgi:hypothetical protein